MVQAYCTLRDLSAINGEPAERAAATQLQGRATTQLLNAACACEPMINHQGILDIFTWTVHAFENNGQNRTAALTLVRQNFVNLVVGLATRREMRDRIQRIDTAIDDDDVNVDWKGPIYVRPKFHTVGTTTSPFP